MSAKEATGADANGSELGQELKFMLKEVPAGGISIKVVGIGGCGGNIVDFMLESGLSGVDYVCLNSDKQALERCNSPHKLTIGQRVTQGYGTGSDPGVGREAALENTEELTELLQDADMVFIVVGLGGGTGTGAAPVIGSIAKQMGALTVVAAVKPYKFEGKRRGMIAEEGFKAILEQVDTAIQIPNEHLLGEVEEGAGFFEGFRVANRLATEILEGITSIISSPGVMNSDFADIRAVFEDAGLAVVGAARADGPDAAMQAAQGALDALIVEPGQLKRSNKILVNLTGSAQFSMHDATSALAFLGREFDDNAELIIGTVRDDSIEDQVRIMVVASSFGQETHEPAGDSEPVADSEGQDDAFWAPEEMQQTNGSPSFGAEGVSDEEPVPDTEHPGFSHEREAADYGQFDAEAEFEAPSRPPEAEDDRHSRGPAAQRLPSGGGPLDFMPPPKIHAEDSEAEQVEPRRSSFFRRRSIFR